MRERLIAANPNFFAQGSSRLQALFLSDIDRETDPAVLDLATVPLCIAFDRSPLLIGCLCFCACACACAGMMAARAAEKRQQIIGTFVAGAGR